jgi:hypothetical protein
VQIANRAFPLRIGCGHYGEPNLWCWVKQISTVDTVVPLTTAIEDVLRRHGQVTDLRWWTAAEVVRG